MYIHKEGRTWILVFLLLYIAIIIIFQNTHEYIFWPIVILYGIFYALILNFFRNPLRIIPEFNDTLIYAPADGKIVVIEEVDEPEFLKTRCKMVSIFMNPLNVHCNRYPISGKVLYSQYHPGKYLVAWHPKASTDNERHTIAIQRADGTQILIRQIAGALARRIVCYAKVGDTFSQGEDLGFIKFGSRVDVYLPLNAQINVEMNQKVSGNVDVIAIIN
jgi:phosphatidylserine decarboxylase